MGSESIWSKCLGSHDVPATSSRRRCLCSFCTHQSAALLPLGFREETTITRTPILLFSLLAVSKLPSRMPFATQRQSRRISQSSWSSVSFTVTSSLGPVTSVNVAPVRTSLLVPSTVGFAVRVPGGDSPALNECDLPEKYHLP